jgi:hypothetical protein
MRKLFFGDDAASGKRSPIPRLRGLSLLFRRMQAWNVMHPPPPERIVIKILNDLEVRFEHGKRVGAGPCTLSFYLPDKRRAIQIVSLRAEFDRRKQRSTNAAGTLRELLKREKIPCLFLSDAELLRDDLSPVVRKIEDFVALVNARRGG